MTALNRRSFLKQSLAAAGVAAVSGRVVSVRGQPRGANDAVRVAVIGLGRKGSDHLQKLLELRGARVAAVCDVDPRYVARAIGGLQKAGVNAFGTTDARRVLERPDVDAVIIATSNHWHALLSVWACEAGRDVYVEKPISHTPWEGRQMLAAARRYQRVVQAGTQARSDVGLPLAIEYVRSGRLGRIQWIHALWYKLREPIGLRPPWYPDGLDYDLYCGPAPVTPLRRDELHYDWHWSWDTGNGELGNIAVHQVDIARWFLGDPVAPRRVLSAGGRYVIDDAAETPNTQITVLDYEAAPVVVETRGLSARPGMQAMDATRGLRQGVIVQCEGGYFAGHIGGAVYDNAGKRIEQFAGDGGATHLGNFLDAVRSRRTESLRGQIVQGHRSTEVCLLGNLSYRLGTNAGLAGARQALGGFPAAVEVVDSVGRHLAVHGLVPENAPCVVGPWLEIDRASGAITGVSRDNGRLLAGARVLERGVHRPPYRLPEVG
jgi:predicted dehydrogenase